MKSPAANTFPWFYSGGFTLRFSLPVALFVLRSCSFIFCLRLSFLFSYSLSPSWCLFVFKGSWTHRHFCPRPCASTNRKARPTTTTDTRDHTTQRSPCTDASFGLVTTACASLPQRLDCLHNTHHPTLHARNMAEKAAHPVVPHTVGRP